MRLLLIQAAAYDRLHPWFARHCRWLGQINDRAVLAFPDRAAAEWFDTALLTYAEWKLRDEASYSHADFLVLRATLFGKNEERVAYDYWSPTIPQAKGSTGDRVDDLLDSAILAGSLGHLASKAGDFDFVGTPVGDLAKAAGPKAALAAILRAACGFTAIDPRALMKSVGDP